MRERRANARYRVWFPVTLIVDGEETTAITYDVSASGVLMACPSDVAPGTGLRLCFQLKLDAPPRDIDAVVLRCEPTDDLLGPWQRRLAVQFEEPQPDLEAILVAASEDGAEGG
ncbi:MAG: PilZ domain-containing protein [Sandaracinaceae bacterium]